MEGAAVEAAGSTEGSVFDLEVSFCGAEEEAVGAAQVRVEGIFEGGDTDGADVICGLGIRCMCYVGHWETYQGVPLN